MIERIFLAFKGFKNGPLEIFFREALWEEFNCRFCLLCGKCNSRLPSNVKSLGG